jgi:type I restriction enzyme, S subunit
MKFINSKIANIAIELKTGKTPPTSISEYFGDEINWYTPGDLDIVKCLGNSMRGITQKAIDEKKAITYKPNTVLISCIGDIGKLGIVDKVSSSNQQITGILPDREKIISEFLYYWLQRNRKILLNASTNAIVPILNNKQLGSIKISYPALIEDQKKIVNLLSKAEGLIKQRKETINLLDDFLRSTFLDMFGHPNTTLYSLKLKDVAYIEMGQSPSGSSYNQIGNGSPLLNGPTEFGTRYPREKQWTTQPTKFSKKGDILFCVRGATTGRLNWSDKKYCIGRGLAAVRSISSVPNEFIHSYLKLQYSFFQKTGTGSTFINISKDQLNNLKFPNADLKLQNEYAQIVERSESLKEQFYNSLRLLENLFGSLSQRAFNGDLIIKTIENEDIEIEVKEESRKILYDEIKVPLVKKRGKPRITKVGKVILENYYEKDIANLIRQYFTGFDFRFSDLIKLLEEEKAISVTYYTTEELKQFRGQNDEIKDLQTFIFDCIQGKCKLLKLKQWFHNAYNDFDLKEITIRADKEEIRRKLVGSPPEINIEDFHGIYFKIIG